MFIENLIDLERLQRALHQLFEIFRQQPRNAGRAQILNRRQARQRMMAARRGEQRHVVTRALIFVRPAQVEHSSPSDLRNTAHRSDTLRAGTTVTPGISSGQSFGLLTTNSRFKCRRAPLRRRDQQNVGVEGQVAQQHRRDQSIDVHPVVHFGRYRIGAIRIAERARADPAGDSRTTRRSVRPVRRADRPVCRSGRTRGASGTDRSNSVPRASARRGARCRAETAQSDRGNGSSRRVR